jgi:transporter family-2 protein
MPWIAILFALVAGAANPFQAGTNAELKTQLAQPLWATLWVYATGLLGVLLIQAFVRQPLPSGAQAHSAPWWAWMGGLISIVATFAGLMLAQKLGSGIFIGISITASIVVSICVDHFALLGVKQHSASPLRMAGGALMIVGVWMVSKF